MLHQPNAVKELEAQQKLIPFLPSATSYGMGWKTLQAVRYSYSRAGGECSLPPIPLHALILTIRPAEKLEVDYDGVRIDRPLSAGSINLIPAGSPLRWRREGNVDGLVVYLEPMVVSEIAAEAFGIDGSDGVLPSLHDLNIPELRAAMLAVDAELRVEGFGGSLLAESFATVLSVHLLRHVTGSPGEEVATAAALPHHKVRRITEYISENLASNPTLEQMAAVVHLSPYHFARQFKAATGLAPHQYVISRRVQRAQDLLRADRRLGLAEVAFRTGFASQSHFCLHFKRLVGVTPRKFMISVKSG
jgi:AraC family transcriptional regulator